MGVTQGNVLALELDKILWQSVSLEKIALGSSNLGPFFKYYDVFLNLLTYLI
jgi:hypothetical protein